MRRCFTITLLALVNLAASAAAGNAGDSDKEQSAWDVASPPGEARDISIDVRSGTWMSLDVSPDGQQVVFDLLGDIYALSITGGEARSLTSGLAWDMQPRFSPDGRHIAFTSDRQGGDNVWIMDANGANPRQVTEEDFRLLNNPVWHPSGRFVAARKHFTTRRSLGTGEIWLYATNGGEGVQLVERPDKEFQKELGEPAFSADGRYVYFTRNSTPGNTFEYAQDTNQEIFQIRRLTLASGDVEPVVTGPGGAVRPTPSPDGRYLAFVRRERSQESFDTALYVKDLRSGRERLLFPGLDRDMQETWGVQGLYPGFAWTPDSTSLVFWAQGGIKRMNVEAGEIDDIPFRVRDQRKALAPIRTTVEVAPDQVQSRMIRFARLSPDGRQIVFEAFGRLWLRAITGNTEARRLTRDEQSAFELYPSWSRDGRRIVFVRWTDEGLGEIHIVSGGGGRSGAVTSEPGHYRYPRFSPDGGTLVFERASGGYLVSPDWALDPGLYRMPAGGGVMERLTESGRYPHFGARGERIFYTHNITPPREEEPAHELVSVDLNGADRRLHATSHYTTWMEVSPSGEWLAFRENYHAFVLPMPPGGTVELSRTRQALPTRRASDTGAEFPSWANGDSLTWTVGPQLYRADLLELFAPTSGEENAAEEVDASDEEDDAGARYGRAVADLSFTREAEKPSGTVALTGARIVTMDDQDRVIDSGVVVIRDNRIVAVGPTGEVPIPEDARRLDLGGRTVLPGLVDVHAHGAQGVDDLIPQQNWLALGHLALGVTTVHDPSNAASEIFAAAEYQRAGVILAPRIFSTGEILYGARSELLAHIDELDDARAHVRRLKAQGAISVKNYNQPRRDQRQMVVTAAREEGLMSVAEGGSLYHMDMSIIADGNTGLEHNAPPERFYDDVLQFWEASGVGYTPTLVVTYGGLRGEDWFYQEADIWQHPVLSRFVPPDVLRPRAVRRQMAPETDYQPFRDAAANARALMERGVTVNIGAHGQREGLAAHWEIWGFVEGGMTPLQALKTATVNPARYLGMDADIGSVESGKLADLLIVDGNPLNDIRMTDKVAYVVLNGRVYEGGTLTETLTGERRLAPFYWQR